MTEQCGAIMFIQDVEFFGNLLTFQICIPGDKPWRLRIKKVGKKLDDEIEILKS